MAITKKKEIENMVITSFNESSKRTFLASPQLGKKRNKERRIPMSSEKEIENLIFNLSEGEKNIVLKKLLEASLINRIKPNITKQNITIMQLVAEGYTSKEISEILDVSKRTIENKLYELTKEFNCRNRTHLTVKLLKAYVIE